MIRLPMPLQIATRNSRFANRVVYNRDAKRERGSMQHGKNAVESSWRIVGGRRRGGREREREKEKYKEMRKKPGFLGAFQLPHVRGCFFTSARVILCAC